MKTNYFELRGIIGNPPDVRYTPNGKTVATFSLYTRERWSDSGSEAREKNQRHLITAWGPLASFAQQRLSKGTRVEITGRIDQQSWGEGESRQYKTVLVASEIVLISSKASQVAPEAVEPAATDEQAAEEPNVVEAAQTEPKRRRAKRAA
jgi:single stranded DNA-binding protein